MEPAGPRRVECRIAAILATDVAGCSRLIGADEEGTLGRLKALRAKLIDPKIAAHKGRIAGRPATACWSSSPALSTRCVARPRCRRRWPRAMPPLPPDHRIEFRIGINVGDIVVEDGESSATASTSRCRLKGSGRAGRTASRHAFRRCCGSPSSQITSPSPCASTGFAKLPPKIHQHQLNRPLPLPDKPLIAVLHFANMSGDQEQEYFADGMVEEIITALSRIRWLFVIARASRFTYKGQAAGTRARAPE